MPVSEAKKRANKKWEKENNKRLSIVFPNKEYETLSNFCTEHNISKNGFVREAVTEKIKRDS